MKVRFSFAGRADIQNIFDFIAAENPQVASRVVSKIQNSSLQLRQFPFSGRIGAINGTREIIIPRLPFIMVYRIVDETVEIIAVFHTAQDKPRGF
jgi:toxin ParE1/3/4